MPEVRGRDFSASIRRYCSMDEHDDPLAERRSKLRDFLETVKARESGEAQGAAPRDGAGLAKTPPTSAADLPASAAKQPAAGTPRSEAASMRAAMADVLRAASELSEVDKIGSALPSAAAAAGPRSGGRRQPNAPPVLATPSSPSSTSPKARRGQWPVEVGGLDTPPRPPPPPSSQPMKAQKGAVPNEIQSGAPTPPSMSSRQLSSASSPSPKARAGAIPPEASIHVTTSCPGVSSPSPKAQVGAILTSAGLRAELSELELTLLSPPRSPLPRVATVAFGATVIQAKVRVLDERIQCTGAAKNRLEEQLVLMQARSEQANKGAQEDGTSWTRRPSEVERSVNRLYSESDARRCRAEDRRARRKQELDEEEAALMPVAAKRRPDEIHRSCQRLHDDSDARHRRFEERRAQQIEDQLSELTPPAQATREECEDAVERLHGQHQRQLARHESRRREAAEREESWLRSSDVSSAYPKQSPEEIKKLIDGVEQRSQLLLARRDQTRMRHGERQETEMKDAQGLRMHAVALRDVSPAPDAVYQRALDHEVRKMMKLERMREAQFAKEMDGDPSAGRVMRPADCEMFFRRLSYFRDLQLQRRANRLEAEQEAARGRTMPKAYAIQFCKAQHDRAQVSREEKRQAREEVRRREDAELKAASVHADAQACWNALPPEQRSLELLCPYYPESAPTGMGKGNVASIKRVAFGDSDLNCAPMDSRPASRSGAASLSLWHASQGMEGPQDLANMLGSVLRQWGGSDHVVWAGRPGRSTSASPRLGAAGPAPWCPNSMWPRASDTAKAKAKSAAVVGIGWPPATRSPRSGARTPGRRCG